MDRETNEPLPFANVKVHNKTNGTSANENGEFQLKNICLCEIELEITYTGYKSKTISVHTDHPDFLNVYLAPNSVLLESVIILGENENIAFKSQNVQSLSGEKIEAKAGSSLGEMLASISGMNMIQTGSNISKPVIQGLNSNRILILNNGVRYEGQQWGAEHAPAIDPLLAQKLEVIKGAASIKYGPGALGGVVLVLPPELRDSQKLHGKVNVSGQSNGGIITASGLLESGFNNGWNWRLQGTFKQGGDLKTPDYNLTNTGLKEYNFSGAVGKKTENSEYELFFSHFNTEIGILKAVGLSENVGDLIEAINADIPEGTEDFSYQINSPKQKVDHSLLKFKSKWFLNDHVLDLQYGYQHNKRQEFDIRRGSLVNIPSMDLTLNTHILDVDLNIKPINFHDITIGLNTLYQQNKNVPGTQTLPFIPNYNSIMTGLYALDQMTVDKLTFEAGARVDFQYFDVAGRDGRNEVFRSRLDFVSFSAIGGLKYKMDQKNFIQMNLSTGWRPPHVSELYSFGTHQSAGAIEYGLLLDENNEIIPVENFDLKSEKSLKWVTTYEHHGNKMHFDLSGYYQILNNFFYLKSSGITNTSRGPFPTFRYRQTRALFTGVDADLQYDFSDRLTMDFLYSFLYSKDLTNDDYFLYIPANRLNLGLTYHLEEILSLDHMDFLINGNYFFQQKNAPESIDLSDPNLSIPESEKNYDFISAPDGYFLLEAGVSFHKRWENHFIEVRLTGENILNKTYKNYTNRLKYYANDKGQNFKIGAIYHF